MTPFDHAPLLLLALVLDAVIGDPGWLYRRAPHPVAMIGGLIGWLDRAWNRDSDPDGVRRGAGVLAILLILVLSAGIGWLLHGLFQRLPHGWVLEAPVASVFLAQQSLYRHVAAVGRGFLTGGLRDARIAVSRIVGRDPDRLDQAGVCRAALESLAENFSDGIVAPAFWYLLLGLPGLLAYKALNTADSMIGHRSDRHRQFGWAAARLDDVANVMPARLSALLFAIGAMACPGAKAGAALDAALRDARHHRSVNAGWPEAALAGALDLKLAGPRIYGDQKVGDAWMGSGRAEAGPNDIRRGLRLFLTADAILIAATGLLWWV